MTEWSATGGGQSQTPASIIRDTDITRKLKTAVYIDVAPTPTGSICTSTVQLLALQHNLRNKCFIVLSHLKTKKLRSKSWILGIEWSIDAERCMATAVQAPYR